MTIEEILAGESKHVEFKERRSADRAKYMKTVIAFANGQGGTLVFGVSDRDRQVIGISKFKGDTRAVFIDKREYTGYLWEQVEGAFQFVLRNIRLGALIEDIYRKDVYELPPASIREVLLNAVMNCSYIQQSGIQVAVFDNRLEITSPGGLMPSVTIDRMKEGDSQIRNKALARVFSYLNLIEAWGTGIPRLYQEVREYGLPDPEIVDMETALRVCIYRSQEWIRDSAEEVPKKCRRNAGKFYADHGSCARCRKYTYTGCDGAPGGQRTPCERSPAADGRSRIFKAGGATSQTRYVLDEKEGASGGAQYGE